MMSVTLSCDHRVVDGAVGVQWLTAFKSFSVRLLNFPRPPPAYMTSLTNSYPRARFSLFRDDRAGVMAGQYRLVCIQQKLFLYSSTTESRFGKRDASLLKS